MELKFDGYTTPFDVSLVKSFGSILRAQPDDDRKVRVTGTLTIEHVEEGEVSKLPESVS